MPAETLHDLENRLGKIGDLRSVVSTMKSLAAVNIRHFEEAADAADRYRTNVERGLQVLMRSAPESAAPVEAIPRGRLLIAVGSDQGMVGRFNELVAGKAGEYLAGGGDDGLLVLGQRVASSFIGSGIEPTQVMPMPGSLGEAVETVRDVQDYLLAADIGPVRVVGNRPAGGAAYETELRRILPLDREFLQRLARREWRSSSLPQIRSAWTPLFERVSTEYLFISIYAALAESLAAENAARLAAMQAAEKNIGEKEDEVRGLFNSRRQASITEELLDIVGGFEALQGG